MQDVVLSVMNDSCDHFGQEDASIHKKEEMKVFQGVVSVSFPTVYMFEDSLCNQCCSDFFRNQDLLRKMESKKDGASLTSEELAAIEDEEVLNKMVTPYNHVLCRVMLIHIHSSHLLKRCGIIFMVTAGRCHRFRREAIDSCCVEGSAEEKER